LTKDIIERRQELIRQSLDQIAAELEREMLQVGLNFPVYLSVPNSGEALISFITSEHPPFREWEEVTAILSRLISSRLSGANLRSVDRAWAVVNSKPASAADVTAAADSANAS
jgi:hypothetical protein